MASNSRVTYFNFESFGHGYCPVTEKVKTASLIEVTDREPVKIGNCKYLLPTCVMPYVQNFAHFYCDTYFEKEEYEDNMKVCYGEGFEANFKLVVHTDPQGKWVNNPQSCLAVRLIAFACDIQLALIRMDNPKNSITSAAFHQDLKSLPEELTKQTAYQFRSFLFKWGTHLIYQQALGGTILFNSLVQKAGFTGDHLKELKVKVNEMFKRFDESQEHPTFHHIQVIKEVSFFNKNLQIDFGNEPGLVTLTSMNPQGLDNWSKNIVKKPKELKKSIQLYPYYNLLEKGKKYESLRQATKMYLEQKSFL